MLLQLYYKQKGIDQFVDLDQSGTNFHGFLPSLHLEIIFVLGWVSRNQRQQQKYIKILDNQLLINVILFNDELEQINEFLVESAELSEAFLLSAFKHVRQNIEELKDRLQ